LRITVEAKQIIRKPYREEISLTASKESIPSLLRNTEGSKSERPDKYNPFAYREKPVEALPKAIHATASPYVPSSGPIALEVLGNAKNATTLTTNEAKTIAYNLLFKVVNLNLKSFMVTLTSSRSLIYGSSRTSVKPLGHADPDSESHTSHCHMGALQEMRV
jgi:hypothetical protein